MRNDFDPWEGLRWQTVRVVRTRQHKRDGTVFEAYWLTDFSKSEAGSQALYHMAKSRWEIENQGFNDGKNRYGMEHICHHQPNSLLVNWLIIALTLTLERLLPLPVPPSRKTPPTETGRIVPTALAQPYAVTRQQLSPRSVPLDRPLQSTPAVSGPRVAQPRETAPENTPLLPTCIQPGDNLCESANPQPSCAFSSETAGSNARILPLAASSLLLSRRPDS